MKYTSIALVGKPNAGKSTILNKIFQQNISIVNAKPQTTRNQIAKIYKDENYEILFVDTPGFHQEKNELDKFLNGEIYRAFKKVDFIFIISDLSRSFDSEDETIAKKIAELKDKKIVLLLNKSDLNNEQKTKDELIGKWKQYLTIDHVFCINQNDFNLLDILNTLSNEFETNADLVNLQEVNLDDKFLIKEVIRNVILRLFRQEVPYATAVVVKDEKYLATKNNYIIHADIYVDKESHKPILIGKKGEMIKKIGIESRIDLANIYDCNISLYLDVKVKKNWKNDVMELKNLGYIIKK